MEQKNIKPKEDKSILELIIFAGVILDTYSVYGFWKDLNDDKSISGILQKNGLAGTDLGLDAAIATMQKGFSLMLIIFLLFDFFAYYRLHDYSNWARKYVMSIAIFYLVGCVFSFSLVYFIYAAFTLYYLWRTPPKEFFY